MLTKKQYSNHILEITVYLLHTMITTKKMRLVKAIEKFYQIEKWTNNKEKRSTKVAANENKSSLAAIFLYKLLITQ